MKKTAQPHISGSFSNEIVPFRFCKFKIFLLYFLCISK